MINGIGVVGWGVGGIEAEAGMLGQPVYFLTPDVVGVHLHGQAARRVTATDLVLTVTEMLRKAKVVGKFVEFFGEGTASLSVPDRATIGNMAPEYGATMGFFPVDDETVELPRGTGRTERRSTPSRRTSRRRDCSACRKPARSTTRKVLELDLATSRPVVAGPKRPQDRIELPKLKRRFAELFSKPVAENGFAKPVGEAAEALSTRLADRRRERRAARFGGGDRQQTSLTPRQRHATSSKWSTTGRRRTSYPRHARAPSSTKSIWATATC